MYSAVIVDDDLWALADMRATFDFESYGFELIAECTSAEEALPILLRESPNLVVTDICMSADSGLDLIGKVREKRPEMLFIILSGHADFSFARQALALGAFRYLLKPIDRDEAGVTMQQVSQELLQRNAKPMEREDMFSRITAYMEDHLCDRLSQQDVAQRFYLSKSYLSEMFRKRLGVTFVEYKERIRVTRAREMLEQTDLSVGEIALRTGYEDVGYFSRVFKKNYAETPQQYRNGVRKRSGGKSGQA